MARTARSRSRAEAPTAPADALMARWLTTVAKDYYPYGLFDSLKLSPRLYRLFAVACCRHPLIDGLLTDPRSRAAVDVAEQYADGLCGNAVLRKAWNDAWAVREEKWDLWRTTAATAATAAAAAATTDAATTAARAAMREYQGRLLVALIGPGWMFSAAWRTDTALALARHVYDARDWGAMPILADAIEDVGCNHGELLALMRDPAAPWLRGARILDELLGKR